MAVPTSLQRMQGGLLGLATGDALGTTLEFQKEGFAPLQDIVGGGPFRLLPGQWTDDTSMALCLAQSLIASNGKFDPVDQLQQYLQWYREGHLSSNGQCFDIGIQTRTSVLLFEKTRAPYPGSSGDLSRAGNGSLMRLAPVPFVYWKHPLLAIDSSALSSKTTHGAQIAVDACRYFAGLLVGALNGASKEELLSPRYSPVPGYWDGHPLVPEIDEIAKGSFKTKNPPELQASGYVVHTLEAVLWAFYHTDNFRDGCLKIVNLGDDADTTGAIFGQIAGTFYGVDAIPESWRAKIFFRELILAMATEIHALSHVVSSDQGAGSGFPSQEYKLLWETYASMETIHAKILRRVLPGPKAFKSAPDFDEELSRAHAEFLEAPPQDPKWKHYIWEELRRCAAQEREEVHQRASARPPAFGGAFALKKKAAE